MLKKRAFVILFALLFFFGACTQDQFSGEFNIEAEVTNMGSTVVSIKYQLGVSEIYDDLVMKEKPAILSQWKEQDLKVVPLKVTISASSDSEGNKNSEVKYYYKSNLVYMSQSFDFDSVRMLASDNFDMFNWEYKDGNTVSKEKKEPAKEKPKSGKVDVGKGEKL